MIETMTGGRQCSRCRRATGGVPIAVKTVALADVAWTAASPDVYPSSPIARRPFCATCGTPLGFQFLDSDAMDLPVGSFDDPFRFRPTSNFSIETALPAGMDTSHLPGKRRDAHPPVADRWKKALGRLPD